MLRAALACALLFSCASARNKPAAPTREGRTLLVVGINDTHGALLPIPPPRWIASGTQSEIGGAEWFAGYLEAMRADQSARGGELVVLDGGDEFQGTLISNQFQGASVTEVYNAAGVTAAALGNHEFDFGVPVLRERIAQARYPILAANLFLKGTRTRPDFIRPSVLIERGGLRIGIIGLATAETALTTNPLHVQDLEFVPGGPVAAEEAEALRARGATVVLIAAHAGPNPPDREIQQIAEAVAGKVDAIVSGHHHVALGPPPLVVANIPIVQSGSKLQNFSTIELTLDAHDRVRGFAVNEQSVPRSGGPHAIVHSWNGAPARWRGREVRPDPKVAAIIARYDAQVKVLRESVVGETGVELRKGGKDDLLGNLAADALRSGAGGGLRARFALQNAGGLRVNEIPRGPITFGQIFDLSPFDNQQVVVELRAAQVRGALEAVLRTGKSPMRVSGLRYLVDWDRFGGRDDRDAPAGAIVTELVDDATGAVLCETRTCSGGRCQPACAEGTFPVAVTDFLANGGDGLSMLIGAPRRMGNVLARDMLVSYLREHRPLTAELLGAGKPRWRQIGSGRRPVSE